MKDAHEILECVDGIARDVVEPNASSWDTPGGWPERPVRALLDAGLGGLVVPRKSGGLGRGREMLLRVCEVLGRADASTGLCYGMHSVATACIAANASSVQTKTLLEPISAGQHLTTLALSEPGTGSHFYLPRAEMRYDTDDENYVVNGTKCFVTNGGHADSYVVSTVAAEADAPPGHFSMVVVPGDSDDLQWGPAWDGWGMRGNASRTMELQGVRVPVDHRLGKEGDQIWYVFHVVAPYFLVAMAGTYLGVAQRAFDEAQGHLADRTYAHTRRAPAHSPVLQHRLGQIWAKVERARRLCYSASARADANEPDALAAVCAAKAEVAHTAVDVVNECMTLVGGIGYRDGSVLGKLLRDARAAHVMSPTTDILYTWIGRSKLNVPLLGE